LGDKVIGKNSELKPAIILSVQCMGLGVIRALGRIGIPIIAVTCGQKDFGDCSRYVTWKIRAPQPDKEESQFLALLVEISEQFCGGLLIPASDEMLTVVSRNKDMLGHHYKVACAEWEVIQRAIDKKLVYSLAGTAGVPIPRTIIPRSIEDVAEYSRSIEYPCLVKPQVGHIYYAHFGRKMSKVNNAEQMLAAYREADELGLKVMIQEFIPGDDSQVVNYNSYVWDSQPLAEFTAQHIRKAPPELGSPCVAISKRVPEVIETGRKVLQIIGFYGFSCIEFKRDPRDGIYKLLDINARHNLSGMLAVHCGVNFPLIQYMHLAEGKVMSAGDWKEEIYWIDLVRDVIFLPRLLLTGYDMSQFIHPYLRPHTFAVFNWQDLVPFFSRLLNLARRLIRQIIVGRTANTKGLSGPDV
jgi:D-aspartate ligase